MVSLNTFSPEVNLTFSTELNENFGNLSDEIVSQSRRIISDSIFYEQKYGSLGVSNFSTHGTQSGSTQDLNEYKFDISDSIGINDVKTVWCENNKDKSEFYVLGTDSAGTAYFIRCDVDRPAGTVSFDAEIIVSSSDLPSDSGDLRQWRAWKSGNGDYIIARIYSHEKNQQEEGDFNYAVASYNSDGDIITNTSLLIDRISSNDSQDSFDFFDFGFNTRAAVGGGKSYEGGAYQKDLYNDSAGDDEVSLEAYSVAYDNSSQSFSYNQKFIKDDSEDNLNAVEIARFQRGDNSISVSEYSAEEDFERVTGHVTTVDLTDGTISDNVVVSGGFEQSAGLSSVGPHQDFLWIEAYEDDQNRRNDYAVIQGSNVIFSDTNYQEEGPDTIYTEYMNVEKGFFVNRKEGEDGGPDIYQNKFYAHRDGTTTTESLTPQYRLREQSYWFDDGSERYGFNVNGTVVELDFAAKTAIEFTLSENVGQNEVFFAGAGLPYGFSQSYISDVPTVEVEGSPDFNSFDESTSSVNCRFVYDGGVLKGSSPIIGSFKQGDYT